MTSSQAGADNGRRHQEGQPQWSCSQSSTRSSSEGDPDRDTVDLAILDTATAGVHGHITAVADAAGYAQVLAWAREHAAGTRVWALEGTGNYGAGLAAFLAESGEDVVEIDRVKRARRGAKNDRVDAVRAAREALSREVQVSPRQRGLREALRVVLTTRQAVLVSRTKAINELKALIVTAPEYLRAGLRGRSLPHQLACVEQLHTTSTSSAEHRMTASRCDRSPRASPSSPSRSASSTPN